MMAAHRDAPGKTEREGSVIRGESRRRKRMSGQREAWGCRRSSQSTLMIFQSPRHLATCR